MVEGHRRHGRVPARRITVPPIPLRWVRIAPIDPHPTRDRYSEGRGILALNLMSSPEAGKTTLLVRTITDVATRSRPAVSTGAVQPNASSSPPSVATNN